MDANHQQACNEASLYGVNDFITVHAAVVQSVQAYLQGSLEHEISRQPERRKVVRATAVLWCISITTARKLFY